MNTVYGRNFSLAFIACVLASPAWLAEPPARADEPDPVLPAAFEAAEPEAEAAEPEAAEPEAAEPEAPEPTPPETPEPAESPFVPVDVPDPETDPSITLDTLALPEARGQERISISLDDVELSQAVSLFMHHSGANIIASPDDLVGRVTVSLTDVLWHEALGSILELHGLLLERTSLDEQLYKIIPRPEGAPEPMFIETFALNFSRPEPLVPGIERLLAPNGQLLFAEGNVISILGTTRQIERVQNMIERVDQRVPQVVIEAKFVELNDRAIRDLGVNWQSLQGYTASVRPAGDWTRTDTRQRITQDGWARARADQASRMDRSADETGEDPYRIRSSDRTDSGGYMRMWGENFEEADFAEGSLTLTPRRELTTEKAFSAVLTADEFALTLSALEGSRGVGIISNPKIIVASGQMASIHVGRKDPEIRAVADTNLGGRLTYQRDGWIESGVRVEVKPIVNTDDIISVEIRPELSRVIDYLESGDTRIQIPVLSTRTITSQFQLPSGRTVAIGGLTETTDTKSVSKVPLLGDIPLIGRFFRHESTEREQEEVIIFVTLALADTDTLERQIGIPSQGQLIHRNVETSEDGVMSFVAPEPRRRARRRAEDLERPVPRR